MFLVGGGCPRGERWSEIRSDSKICRGLNPSADSCRHQKLEQATQAVAEAAKCRENLHMAKNDKYRKPGKIDSWIERIKISINVCVSSVCVSQPYLWDSEKDMANGCVCCVKCLFVCTIVLCEFCVYLTS